MTITLYRFDGKIATYTGVLMYSYDHGLLIFTVASPGGSAKEIRTSLPFLIE